MGANDGETFLNADPNHLFSSMYSSVNGHTFEGQRQRVEITTFDSLMTKFGIAHCDYLKLDCEGAEHDIFGSMSLATAKRIGQITMEVHKIPDHSNETLEKSITALNYRRIGDSTLPFYVRAPEAA